MDLEDTNKKTDRRVVKTKRAIRNAFAKLLTLKHFDEITIKDIADEAYVNRKTIYNYYNGTYEILNEIENELADSFNEVIKDLDFKNIESTEIVFDRLTNFINSNLDFCGHLLNMDVNSLLVRKIIHMLKALLKDCFISQDLYQVDKVDTIVDYIAAGMIGAYQCWFNKDSKQSIDEFSKIVSTLVYNGINAFKK